MSLKKALLAATVLALPVAAQAQPVTGLYVGAGAGINYMQESDATISGGTYNTVAPGFRTGSLEFSLGWGGVISLGYGFGNGVRVELEGNYRQNDVDGVTGFPAHTGSRTSGGTARSYGAMVNALYDFDLGPGAAVYPYLGLGAGYIVTDYDNVYVRSANGVTQINGDNGQFAYQAIAGLAIPLTSMAPGLSLTVEYRFMGTLSPELDATTRNAAGAVIARGNAEVDNFNHSGFIGLRYAFGVTPPPAPAPVAAAPQIARTYLVFFDWNRADLSERARQIIAEAAQNSRSVGTTRIEVSGHADRSGSVQYNQRLSERRAQAVAAELERQGVARSAMVIQAFGETRPLVPTADGVREPQNRRVEIVLR